MRKRSPLSSFGRSSLPVPPQGEFSSESILLLERVPLQEGCLTMEGVSGMIIQELQDRHLSERSEEERERREGHP